MKVELEGALRNQQPLAVFMWCPRLWTQSRCLSNWFMIKSVLELVLEGSSDMQYSIIKSMCPSWFLCEKNFMSSS